MLTCCSSEWTTVDDDPRFAYRWTSVDAYIQLTFINEEGKRVERVARSLDDAYDIMLQQARPHGSLRIGDIVRTITSTAGISACGKCKARQLRMNRW